LARAAYAYEQFWTKLAGYFVVFVETGFATSSTDECTPFTSTQTMLKFKMSKKERKRSPKSSAGAPIKPSSTSHSQDQKTTDSSAVTVKNLPIKEEEDLSFPCHFSKGQRVLFSSKICSQKINQSTGKLFR
jgi:hypothetical protein